MLKVLLDTTKKDRFRARGQKQNSSEKDRLLVFDCICIDLFSIND